MTREFKIIKKIGESGLGPIFLVERCQSGEKRILKTLAPGYSSQPKIRENFESLDQSSHLQHLNIRRTYGLIEHDGSIAVEQEYIEGDSLDIVLTKQDLLSVEDCLPIFKDLCSALSYAHKKGAIHGDINPRHVFLEHSTSRTVLGSFQFPEGFRV
ncbi:MAG: protein kinase, partial [Planctomycetota bacterium]|nr:protein kinase [Planctomycetota bacterium]